MECGNSEFKLYLDSDSEMSNSMPPIHRSSECCPVASGSWNKTNLTVENLESPWTKLNWQNLGLCHSCLGYPGFSFTDSVASIVILPSFRTEVEKLKAEKAGRVFTGLLGFKTHGSGRTRGSSQRSIAVNSETPGQAHITLFDNKGKHTISQTNPFAVPVVCFHMNLRLQCVENCTGCAYPVAPRSHCGT